MSWGIGKRLQALTKVSCQRSFRAPSLTKTSTAHLVQCSMLSSCWLTGLLLLYCVTCKLLPG